MPFDFTPFHSYSLVYIESDPKTRLHDPAFCDRGETKAIKKINRSEKNNNKKMHKCDRRNQKDGREKQFAVKTKDESKGKLDPTKRNARAEEEADARENMF